MKIYDMRFFFLYFGIALLLMIVPLPKLLNSLRPPFLLLFFLYCQWFYPHYHRLILVMITGLMLDVILGAFLGTHTLGMMIAMLLAETKARRFQFFNVFQQVAFVCSLVFIYEGTIYLTYLLMGFEPALLVYGIKVISSGFIWYFFAQYDLAYLKQID